MDEVAVDVEKAGAVGRLLNQVVGPYLVVKGFRGGHGAKSGWIVRISTPVTVSLKLTEDRSGVAEPPARAPASGCEAKRIHGHVPGEEAPRQAGPVVDDRQKGQMAGFHEA
jgi:hypothetical protein